MTKLANWSRTRRYPRSGTRRIVLATTAVASVITASAAMSLPTVIRGIGTPTVSASATVYETGPSDAASIAIYSGQPGWKNTFWWDHPNLTVAVRGAANSDPAELQAMRDAIEIWRSTLAERFPQVSVTHVTDTQGPGQPDIVLRLVPHAGGVQWSGVTNCGVQYCPSVIVRTDVPPGTKGEFAGDRVDEATTLRVERTTLHELGHALGIGHVSPLDSSLDLMGYGWANADPDLTPILSDCDIEGVKAVFGWVLAGEAPHRSLVDKVTRAP
jgi:hypothetical protein